MQPALFGLQKSNRDFSKKSDWGKNVFNNAFPVSLLCYMGSKNIDPVYVSVADNGAIQRTHIGVEEVFGNVTSSKLFFAFESLYTPYEAYVSDTLPRVDLVTFRLDALQRPVSACKAIEIKLTAVPDNSTSELDVDCYSPELVIRPDTIVYVALAIADKYRENRVVLQNILRPLCSTIENWDSLVEMSSKLDEVVECLQHVLIHSRQHQTALLLQPIWRTKGKTLELEQNCVDCFVWSDHAIVRLFMDRHKPGQSTDKISRPMRSCIWLLKMLYDYSNNGRIDHSATIRSISFGSQTDKAFSVNGRITIDYLRSEELLSPRVRKFEIADIVLHGGHKMLSPERRFDAALLSNRELFEDKK